MANATLIDQIVYVLKKLLYRTFVDPTYDMTYEEKRRYYREKEIWEHRAHEEKIARIQANQHIRVDEVHHQTYENLNKRWRF